MFRKLVEFCPSMKLQVPIPIFLLLICCCKGLQGNGPKVHTVHWYSGNPIFRIDNNDHIFDVNRGNLPFEYDQVNIICPSKLADDGQYEQFIIYSVSKEEYDSCRITDPNPRIIAVCDQPGKLLYFTITFRSFTPQPGGLEFRPGQDYFFISTSTPSDIHRRVGGRCKTHNMKVEFRVCCKDQENLQITETNSLSRFPEEAQAVDEIVNPEENSPIHFFKNQRASEAVLFEEHQRRELFMSQSSTSSSTPSTTTSSTFPTTTPRRFASYYPRRKMESETRRSVEDQRAEIVQRNYGFPIFSIKSRPSQHVERESYYRFNGLKRLQQSEETSSASSRTSSSAWLSATASLAVLLTLWRRSVRTNQSTPSVSLSLVDNLSRIT
ncbi:unnamed protein product [Cyprideis torosa]|uniref:Uncharacterized protein n=1 Tax=Cyprideis torosa TaxID=163714 RepID=A0A7R8W4T8_9CRUS|nr:unnamed protein product [Cyprideis torosa]CAG0880947.1 unnamed protein product [Cyprideis torosa]